MMAHARYEATLNKVCPLISLHATNDVVVVVATLAVVVATAVAVVVLGALVVVVMALPEGGSFVNEGPVLLVGFSSPACSPKRNGWTVSVSSQATVIDAKQLRRKWETILSRA